MLGITFVLCRYTVGERRSRTRALSPLIFIKNAHLERVFSEIVVVDQIGAFILFRVHFFTITVAVKWFAVTMREENWSLMDTYDILMSIETTVSKLSRFWFTTSRDIVYNTRIMGCELPFSNIKKNIRC